MYHAAPNEPDGAQNLRSTARRLTRAQTRSGLRRLGRTELSRVAEIDRRERIDALHEQHGTELVARHGYWSASGWDLDGRGEHSVEARVHELRGRGFQPMADPLPELFEREPEDVHLRTML